MQSKELSLLLQYIYINISLNEKYKKIQNERIVSDKKLIKTFEDQILIPKIMDTQKNDFFGNFIKNLSRLSRKFL